MPGRLAGKVALVTGASPNIGGTAALGFAKEGARIACNDLEPAVAEQTAAWIRREGGEAMAVPADVTDEAQVKAMVAKVLATWGKIDVLFNNAVMWTSGGVLNMPKETFMRALEVMCGGALLCTKHVAQSMVDRGIHGSIICTLSGAAWQGQPGNLAYCTGKSGLVNFVRSTAMELASYGIRVNGFTPTATQPDNAEAIARSRARMAARPGSAAAPAYTYDFDGLIPLGRRPNASEYAAALVFLASDESAMITGTDIKVDGGAFAKYWPWVPAKKSEAVPSGGRP